MEGTPQRKKARFSQHPQIFEYSSKNKKDNDIDNDSLLLDIHQQQNQKMINTNKVQQNQQIDSNAQRQLQIDQITSDLAQIQAYLQQQSKPLPQHQIQTNIQTNQLTPNKNNKINQHAERFSINFRPQLRSGRQTMNIQQQIKVRSTIKQLQDDISNNKKRMINQQNKQKQKQKQKQKTIDERIQNQLKKNKRITMDVKQLMNIINQYNSVDQQKKIKDERKNRITMDVFALSKLIQNCQEDNDDTSVNDPNLNFNITPIKNMDKSTRKNNVFSAFKQNPHSVQVKLVVNSYLSDTPKRLHQKKTENKKLQQFASDLKSQILKLDLKISDAKKRSQKRLSQKQALERKVKLMNEQLNKKSYLQDIQAVNNYQNQLMMKVLKLQTQQQGYYGHFIFDGIFLKIKSKGKSGGSSIKLMISQQAKQNQKYFLLSIQQSLKILKNYHEKLQQRNEQFMQTVYRLRTAYTRLQKIDNDLYYLSLVFELKDFELNSNLDRLSFHVCIGGNNSLLVEINILLYLNDQTDRKLISIYDPNKPGYISFENIQKIKPKQEQKGKNYDSIVFETIRNLVQIGGVISKT